MAEIWVRQPCYTPQEKRNEFYQNDQCFECGEKGHRARNCPKRKNQSGPNSKNQNQHRSQVAAVKAKRDRQVAALQSEITALKKRGAILAMGMDKKPKNKKQKAAAAAVAAAAEDNVDLNDREAEKSAPSPASLRKAKNYFLNLSI